MPKNVFTILDELAANIAELRDTLAPLAALTGSPQQHTGETQRSTRRRLTRTRKREKDQEKTKPPSRPEKKGGTRLSPKVLLHLTYLAALRNAGSKSEQAKVKKIRQEKGAEAAIAYAESRQRVPNSRS